MMKKAFWWILGILLSPVLLFVILTLLLYLPPVQNWAVDKVAAIASEKTGMQITVGHVNLSFPLDLAVDGFKVIHAPDTIADVERLVVDVQLLPLFRNRVVINELEVTNTSLNTNGFVEAACVKGNFRRLFVASRGIDLDQQTIEANGARLEDARLDIQLNDSVPKDSTKTETLWMIHVDSLVVSRSDVVLHMPGDTMSVDAHIGTLTARKAQLDLGEQTYKVGSVDWVNGALKYDRNYQPRIEGLDYNHIALSNISIGIDNIYFHDPTLKLNLRQLALKEKSGLQVTEMNGQLSLVDGNIRLPRFRLKTPESDVYMELDFPKSVMDSIDPGKLHLLIDARVARQDMMHFLRDLPRPMLERWPYYPLSLKGEVNGNVEYIKFSDLDVDLPTAFHANATGYATNFADPKRIQGDVTFSLKTQNLGFLMAALPRDAQRNYRLPPMSAEGHVKRKGADYSATVKAREGSGLMDLDGDFNANDQSYSARLYVHNMNVRHFMPRDSIFNINGDVTVNGKGFDFLSPKTSLFGYATINQVHYKHWDLVDITSQASIRNGRMLVDLESHNDLLDGRIELDAIVDPKRFVGNVVVDVTNADLHEMGLMNNPLTIGMCGSVDVTSDLKKTHYASGLVSDFIIRDSAQSLRSEFVGIHLRTAPDTTLVRLQSGDFIVKLDAGTDYEVLGKQFAVLGDSVAGQLRRKVIDQPALWRLLPTMKMHVESKRNNPLATLLKSGQDIDFKELLFDMEISAETGINGNGHIHSLVASNVRLDTINFRLTQRKNHLSFGGQIRNNKRNPQFVFNALFDGVLQERGATFGVRYYDAANKLGARLGAQAEVVDSGLRLHLVPERPTIGYKDFNLNKDNFLLLSPHGKVQAHLDLIADDGTGLKLYSENSDSTALQDITLSLNKIDLNELTSVIPYAPRMTGSMNGDYHVVQNAAGQLSVVSDMNVRQMTYEHCPIGNVSTEMVYLQKGDSTHAVEARLMRDDVEIGLLTGTYYDKGEGAIDAKFLMKHLPLEFINGFIPNQAFGLKGFTDGEVAVKGRLSSPKVDGEIYLDSTYLVSEPYGVNMRFDNDPVRIVGSKLLFENFSAYSQYNNAPLTLQGHVDFSNTEKIGLSLRMRARDYQIVGARETTKSVAYGKAFVNIFASMQGTLDDLTMRGRLDLLPSTDLYYILRDSPLTTDNELDNLVKFTDFSDTTQVVVERPAINGFRMNMSLNVSQGAHVKAWLNTDHSNYVDLMGGGTLRMSYTPADAMQLTGRYTISNGEMKYSLPIIPLKTFTIQDGSYIEFTGDMMNPTLNIAATERVRSNVSGSNGVARTVDFDCGVKISRTLSDMGLEFTLDAPEDMQLHSELQSLSVEQRGKLAVAMLTTGVYLDNADTQGFSMNSALSSFLNSGITSITGNALRTLDLSFGMDNSTDASGQTHTDYSFKFAKRFLNNRLRLSMGGKVTSGAELQQRNNSFFDNFTMEYRLDNNATKYVNLYYQNNAYDWLDGYTQKYGGGFTWRKSLQNLTDLFRRTVQLQPLRQNAVLRRDSVATDSLKQNSHATK